MIDFKLKLLLEIKWLLNIFFKNFNLVESYNKLKYVWFINIVCYYVLFKEKIDRIMGSDS